MENSKKIKPLYQEMYFAWRLYNHLQQAEDETHYIYSASDEFKSNLKKIAHNALTIASNAEEKYNESIKELNQ